jgi:hypothetical protein
LVASCKRAGQGEAQLILTSAISVFLQAPPQAAAPSWTLKPAEWITIAAIVIGPIAAVLTQLWIQARKAKRDQKLWVYGTLLSLRATWIAPEFVRAMNFVDVVFYKNDEVRNKRAELMAHIKKTTKEDGTVEQVDWDRAEDLFAEMLDLMGKGLGYNFAHTQIKKTAYYPVGQSKLDAAEFELREKGLAVLEGRASIGVVVRTDAPAQPAQPAHRPR